MFVVMFVENTGLSADARATLDEAILYSSELAANLPEHISPEDDDVINTMDAVEFASLQLSETTTQMVQRLGEDITFLLTSSDRLEAVAQLLRQRGCADAAAMIDTDAVRSSLQQLQQSITCSSSAPLVAAATIAVAGKATDLADQEVQTEHDTAASDACCQTDDSLFEAQIAALNVRIRNMTRDNQELVCSRVLVHLSLIPTGNHDAGRTD